MDRSSSYLSSLVITCIVALSHAFELDPRLGGDDASVCHALRLPCLDENASLVHGLGYGAGGIHRRIDPDIDDRGHAGLAHRFAGALQRSGDHRRVTDFFAVAAEHFGEFAERHVGEQVADVTALLTVFGELAIADLVHRRVVTDHGHVGCVEAVGRFHVEGGHAEGTVAVVAEHFLLRIGEPGGDGATGAHPERAQRTGIHPLTGAARAHGLRRYRHHIAAV